jgi:general stress protein 26
MPVFKNTLSRHRSKLENIWKFKLPTWFGLQQLVHDFARSLLKYTDYKNGKIQMWISTVKHKHFVDDFLSLSKKYVISLSGRFAFTFQGLHLYF